MRVLSVGKGDVLAIGFVPNSAALVVSHAKAGLQVWDLTSAEPPRTLTSTFTRSLTFSADGRQVIKAESNGRIGINLEDRKQIPLGPNASTPSSLSDFAQTPDGTRLLLVHGPYHAPRFSGWRHTTAGWVEDWVAQPNVGLTTGLALSPTGDRFVHLTRTPKVGWPWSYILTVRDATTGLELEQADYPYSYSSQFRFRPDGEQLIGVHEMTLLVWAIPGAGKPRAVRNDSRRHFTAAAFHPSGRYLFTTSNDTTVLVWDTATWQHVTRFIWNIGRLRNVAVSPDGALAAAASDKGQIVVWDVDL